MFRVTRKVWDNNLLTLICHPNSAWTAAAGIIWGQPGLGKILLKWYQDTLIQYLEDAVWYSILKKYPRCYTHTKCRYFYRVLGSFCCINSTGASVIVNCVLIDELTEWTVKFRFLHCGRQHLQQWAWAGQRCSFKVSVSFTQWNIWKMCKIFMWNVS